MDDRGTQTPLSKVTGEILSQRDENLTSKFVADCLIYPYNMPFSCEFAIKMSHSNSNLVLTGSLLAGSRVWPHSSLGVFEISHRTSRQLLDAVPTQHKQ